MVFEEEEAPLLACLGDLLRDEEVRGWVWAGGGEGGDVYDGEGGGLA